MHPHNTFWRTLKLAILTLACWTDGLGVALAQRTGDAPKATGSGDWTLAYALLIAGVVLGLLFVLKSSNRSDREGPAKYVEKNILKEE